MTNKQEKPKKTDPASKPVIKMFGTICANNSCQEHWIPYAGEDYFSIRSTVPGKEIPWVSYGTGFVCAKTLCPSIPWDKLNKLGFIFGRQVYIDGKEYLCRSLKVGTEPGVPNEWDDILAALGDSNETWSWKSSWFWGQETLPNEPTYRVCRGYTSARGLRIHSLHAEEVTVGFRPVLEPLVRLTQENRPYLGSKVSVWVGNGVEIRGILCGVDDYDIILESDVKVPPYNPWICRTDNRVLINQQRAWLKEELGHGM